VLDSKTGPGRRVYFEDPYYDYGYGDPCRNKERPELLGVIEEFVPRTVASNVHTKIYGLESSRWSDKPTIFIELNYPYGTTEEESLEFTKDTLRAISKHLAEVYGKYSVFADGFRDNEGNKI
jgi:hypothetical protein